jgi:hypothetical protein
LNCPLDTLPKPDIECGHTPTKGPTVKTLDLTPGTTVRVPAAINAAGYTATVESVAPWMLTAGPKAGQQATGAKRVPLWAVTLSGVTLTGPAKHHADESPVRLAAAAADDEWTVE